MCHDYNSTPNCKTHEQVDILSSLYSVWIYNSTPKMLWYSTSRYACQEYREIIKVFQGKSKLWIFVKWKRKIAFGANDFLA